jgi:hypothetical protein
MTTRIAARLDRDFKAAERDQALYIVASVLESDPDRTPDGIERVHAALLRLASGNLQRLLDAAALAELDWRDLFVDAGLENDDWRELVAEDFGPPDATSSRDIRRR